MSIYTCYTRSNTIVPVLEHRKPSPLLLQGELLIAVEGRHDSSIFVSIAVERDAECTRLPFSWPEECSHGQIMPMCTCFLTIPTSSCGSKYD